MNLLRALATVSSLTFLSRILGYVRDFFIARMFGAGLATDAFFVAFRIPNLLRRMFAEGAFSQAFVPILSEYRNRQSAEETRALWTSSPPRCSWSWSGPRPSACWPRPPSATCSCPTGTTTGPSSSR
jgi:hypothetical protein